MSGGVLLPWTVFVVAAAGVAALQPQLAHAAHVAGEREDVYALPPPGQLHAATLGWDAAVVDALWAKLLVQYGEHWVEKRDFEDVPRYADAILEIEPSYKPLYKIISSMLVYRPMQGNERDARAARVYLQKGLKEYPDDAKLWLDYGMFTAFSGSAFLSDEKDRQAWREEGARAMQHAVELGADPERAMTAASIFSKAGQLEGALHTLEQAYAFTDHPAMGEEHEVIARKIREVRQMVIDAGGTPPPPPPGLQP